MSLIDTHAHLDDRRFVDDFDGVLTRAKEANLERIIAVATTAASTQSVVSFARTHPVLRATVGIHPNNIAEEPAGAWDVILAHANDPLVVGLGETGLDRHWKDTPFEVQEDYFARHLRLSRETGLPVVIHCREADADVVRMLTAEFDARGPIRGVLHSFCGDLAMAEACLAMGLDISFSGMITYKNADALRQTAARLPLGRLMVETDCPYLAPVPVRGQRNEPAHVQHTARKLAEVLNVTFEDLGRETTANANRLFRRETPR